MGVRVFDKAAACAGVLLLAGMCSGCPQQGAPVAAPPPQATAPAIKAPVPTQQTTAAANASAIAANKAQQLITQVEASYRKGVDDYRNNHLDAARQDFDAAVDMMLTSGVDIKSDPQLSDEFEHVVDAVNSLEMDALKQGNGFAPKVEQAPVDAANDVTFPSDAKLTAQLTAELKTTQSDMPLVINDYVAGFINYFTNSQAGHATLVHSLERAGRYKQMISRVLQEEGVPQDLIYQAVAESGFQPQALNARSGAAGMWQFMPFSSYGLARNGWVDERFDPEKSSRAYARYIKELHNQFGDWYLAMAAYDWGPGNVQRAVQRTGYADFWELYRRNVLPQETKNYVPGILAAIIMAKNPKQYGLDSLAPDPPVLSDKITVSYSVDLRLVADVTGATVGEIVALNPSLLRMNTPRDLDFDLHLPPGTLALYQKRIKDIPETKRAIWRYHVVKAGESLDAIAESFHVKARDLAQANDLDVTDELSTGDELVVPTAPAVAAIGVHAQRYTVRHGDTLITVADRFGITVEQLRNWNHMRSTKIAPGHVLNVAEPVRLAPSARGHRRGSHAASSTAKTSSRATKTTSAHAKTTQAKSKTSASAGSGKRTTKKKGSSK